jgi:hypothetical protein
MVSTPIEQIVYTERKRVKAGAVAGGHHKDSKMMNIEITGLDKLQRQLNDASQALQALDGEISAVNFNPHDPSSVEAAVVQVEQAIDAKIAPYRGNAIVENVATQLKDRYRQEIYDRAAKARLQAEAS